MLPKARVKVLTSGDDIKTLFSALLMVKDKMFREYTECKKEQYEDKYSITLIVDKLILFAHNKYNGCTEVSNCVRGTTSRDCQEIVALKSEMKNMKGGLSLVSIIPKKHLAGDMNKNPVRQSNNISN